MMKPKKIDMNPFAELLDSLKNRNVSMYQDSRERQKFEPILFCIRTFSISISISSNFKCAMRLKENNFFRLRHFDLFGQF